MSQTVVNEELILSIIEATDNGKLDWQIKPADDYTEYEVLLSGRSFSVMKGHSRDSRLWVYFNTLLIETAYSKVLYRSILDYHEKRRQIEIASAKKFVENFKLEI